MVFTTWMFSKTFQRRECLTDPNVFVLHKNTMVSLFHPFGRLDLKPDHWSGTNNSTLSSLVSQWKGKKLFNFSTFQQGSRFHPILERFYMNGYPSVHSCFTLNSNTLLPFLWRAARFFYWGELAQLLPLFGSNLWIEIRENNASSCCFCNGSHATHGPQVLAKNPTPVTWIA